MSIEPPKTKKKSFLADLFGEIPSLADLEEASLRSNQAQGNHSSSATSPAKNEQHDLLPVKLEQQPTDLGAIKTNEPIKQVFASSTIKKEAIKSPSACNQKHGLVDSGMKLESEQIRDQGAYQPATPEATFRKTNQTADIDAKIKLEPTHPEGSTSNSEIDYNSSLQNSKPSVSIDELLNYINVTNKERQETCPHVTPPYSPPSHGLDDFEKRKIKEKKSKKHRKKRNAKQATMGHKDRPLESLDDMEFDSLLDSYTQVQQKGKRKREEEQSEQKPPGDIMDVAAEILGRPVNKVVKKHPQQQKHQQHRQHNHPQKGGHNTKQQNNTQKSHGNGTNNNNNANQNKNNIKKEWVPEKVCVFWQNGHCKDGDKCTFKHEGEQIKKLCQFIQSQSCQKGMDCEFSHDLKSEPCRFYFVDTCKAENECPYYHGELTETMKTKLHKMTGYCRFFHFKGYCNTGDKCPFSHEPITDQEELSKLEGSITPCKYFKLGKCKAGNECFYNH